MARQSGEDGSRIGITAASAYLPDAVVSSAALEDRIAAASHGLAIPRGMIERVTGIRTRRFAAADQQASDLAVAAAECLFAEADVDRSTIDVLIFASASQDILEPATAHIVQHKLGTRAHVFDVTNACNSFVNGIDVAASMVRAGRAHRALVVSGELPSRAIRLEVESLNQLRAGFAGYTFGDSGTAVLVEPVEHGGLLHIRMEAHSQHWGIGGIFGGGTWKTRDYDWSYFHGDGEELRMAFEEIGATPLHAFLAEAAMTIEDFTWILCHQVTDAYLRRFVDVCELPEKRVVRTIAEYGNLASCTLGFQLASVYDDLAPGERVLIIGMGGGISTAALALER